MFDILPNEINAKIFTYLGREEYSSIVSKKYYAISVEVSKQYELELLAEFVTRIQKQIDKQNYPLVSEELLTIKQQVCQRKTASTIQRLSEIRQYVDTTKVELRKVLLKLEVAALEKINIKDIAILPLGFRFFYLRLVCDKKMSGIDLHQSRDNIIITLVEQCIGNNDLAKAKELANKAYDKEASTMPIELFQARTNPEPFLYKLTTQAHHQLFNAEQEFYKIQQMMFPFIALCEQHQHTKILERLNDTFCNQTFLTSYTDLRKTEAVLNVKVNVVHSLVNIYIKTNHPSKAVELADRLLHTKNFYYSRFPNESTWSPWHNTMLSFQDTVISMANSAFYSVGLHFLNKGHYSEVIEIAKKMVSTWKRKPYSSDDYEGSYECQADPDNLFSQLIKHANRSDQGLKYLFLVYFDIRNWTLREQIMLELIQQALAVDKPEKITALLPRFSRTQITGSLAFEQLVNYYLQRNDQQNALLYLESIKDFEVRKRVLDKMSKEQEYSDGLI